MSEKSFRPTLYLLDSCPFSFKALLFIAESGQTAKFDIETVEARSEEEKALKEKLAQHFEKVTFPTVEVASGEFINESDEIIAHFRADKAPREYAAYNFYERTLLPEINRLWKENNELKARGEKHG